MANEKDQNTIGLTTFYSTVSQLYLSMALVLAASKSDQEWFYWFVMFYLILMQFLCVGYFIWLRWGKGGAGKMDAATTTPPRDGGPN